MILVNLVKLSLSIHIFILSLHFLDAILAVIFLHDAGGKNLIFKYYAFVGVLNITNDITYP